MSRPYDLAVIGGGPAGCAAAIAAIRAAPRAKILLLEAGRYPRHKVCGEFISPEGIEVLRQLGGLDSLLTASLRIPQARLFFDAQELSAPIAPPAASITRYDLDFALWQLAASSGIECRQESALDGLSTTDTGWEIAIASRSPDAGARSITVNVDLRARAVINAAGRWSRLTQQSTPTQTGSLGVSQKRGQQHNPGQNRVHNNDKWIGLKQHFREASARVAAPSSGSQPTLDSPPTVDLYFFSEGYCGVQPIAPGVVNACAMVHADAASGLEEVFALHDELLRRSRGWEPASPPVTTSPLIFHTPAPLQAGILNVGDAAAFIDPFVGDGITLALRSGSLAGQCLSSFLRSEAPLAKASQDYERRYLRELAPVFRSASQVRRLIHLPKIIRGPLLNAIRFSQAAGLLVQRTRIPA